jgi:hypothetical protein
MKRKEILEKLIRFKHPRDIESFYQEIKKYPWDIDEPLVQLKVDDILRVIDRAFVGELKLNDIFDWADALEVREDVQFEKNQEREIKLCLFKLANHEISGIKSIADLKQLTIIFMNRKQTDPTQAVN